MRRLYILLVSTILLVSYAQAQTGPRFGFKAGANYSNVSGKGVEHKDMYQSKLGFIGGITANFSFSDDNFISIQPELLYSQRGFRFGDKEYQLGVNNITYRLKGKVSYNYLDLPVLLRINTGGLFVEVGPQISYLLSIKDEHEFKLGDRDYQEAVTYTKDTSSKFEIGYATGLGYQLHNGVNLGLRYTGGINSIEKGDDNEFTNARHSTFQLTLGYLFGGR